MQVSKASGKGIGQQGETILLLYTSRSLSWL